MDDDKLYIEISNKNMYICNRNIDMTDLEKLITNKNLNTLSILPTQSAYYTKEKLHMDFYCEIITKLLSLVISNEIPLYTLELPFLDDGAIIFLQYLNVHTLVILDFTIGHYTKEKLYEYLFQNDIKRINYLCDNDNNDNNLIINELSGKFNKIEWGCYFFNKDITQLKEIDILNYIVQCNKKQFNVNIKLGELAKLSNGILDFDGVILPENSFGIITKWFVDNINVYDVFWNTIKKKDYLVCYEVDKQYKIICNDVIKYINKKYPNSRITQANCVCSKNEWNVI